MADIGFFDRRNGKWFVVFVVVKEDMGIIVFFLEVTVVGEVKEAINEEVVAGDTSYSAEIVGK